MEKMKRMSIETLRNEFTEIEKTEQAYYVGKATYAFYKGEWQYRNDLGSSMGWDFLTYMDKNGKVQQIQIGYGVGECLAYGKNMAEGTAKQVFETMANNTNVEWGMTIRYDGTANVYTDNQNDNVKQRFIPGVTSKVVHSHTSSEEGAPSTSDIQNARYNSGVGFALYVNGQYTDYSRGILSNPVSNIL